MELKICLLLLLCYIHVSLQIIQDHETDIWSALAENINDEQNYGVQNTHGLLHQTDISKINDLALLEKDFKQNSEIVDFEHEHTKPYLQHSNAAAREQDVSKEQLYVFLDKGRVRYIPLNEYQKTIVHHSPMNVNGRDVHLPAEQVFHSMGLNHHLLSDKSHNHTPHCSLCKTRKVPQQTVKTFNEENHKLKCNHRQNHNQKHYYETHKSSSNVFNQDHTYQSQAHLIRHKTTNPSILKKRGCKTTKGYGMIRPKYTQHEYHSNVRKSHEDCIPNGSALKNKAIMQNTGIRVELTQQSNVLLGSAQKQTDNNLIQTPISAQPNIRKNEQSLTTIHQGVIKVSSPNTSSVQTTINKLESETLDGSLSGLTKGASNFEANGIEIPGQTEPPILGSALHTDSPIFYIKLKRPKIESETADQKHHNIEQDFGNQNFAQKNPRSSDTFSVTENIKDLPNGENKIITFNNLQPLVENDIQNPVATTIPTIEKQELTVVTETLDGDHNLNSPIENANRLEDLAPSEDRLYAYVTKLEKKGRETRKKKKGSKLKTSNSLEPIAYETYLMETDDKPKINKNDQKVHFIPKPKRFIEHHSEGKKQRKPKTLRATMALISPTSTMEPALLLQGIESRENKQNDENRFERSNSERIRKIQLQGNQEISNFKVNDSQVLGSNHMSDSHFLDKANFQISSSPPLNMINGLKTNSYGSREYNSRIPERKISQHIYTDADIHGIRGDCSDSNELAFDDDQYFDIENNVTPAHPSSYSDLCY